MSGGSFTTRGPLVVAAEDLVAGPLAEPLNAEWRAIPGSTASRPESIAAVEALATGIDARINAALPFSNQAQVLTRLPTILATVDRSVLVTQAGILLLLIQFGVLAGYAVILVAALLLERRRTETALLRARGGGFGHLVSMAFGEALLVDGPGGDRGPLGGGAARPGRPAQPRARGRRARDAAARAGARSRSRSSAARSRSSR